MRKISLVLLVTSTALHSLAQQTVTKKVGAYINTFEVAADGKKDGYFLQTTNPEGYHDSEGFHLSLPLRATLVNFGTYRQGQKTGMWYSFYPNQNGRVKEAAEFKGGVKYGLYQSYWEHNQQPGIDSCQVEDLACFANNLAKFEGSVQSIGQYENGRRVGKWTFYSGNGQITQEYDFDINQVLYRIEQDTILGDTYIGGTSNFVAEMGTNETLEKLIQTVLTKGIKSCGLRFKVLPNNEITIKRSMQPNRMDAEVYSLLTKVVMDTQA